jgi:hypothetical protein
VLTSHDSLVTFPEYAERVSQIMIEAFGSSGIRPKNEIIPRSDPGDQVDR